MAKKRAKRASKTPVKRAKRRPTKRAAKPAAPSLAAVARKIVRATQQPGFRFVTLYRADATSTEATGVTARGHAELEEKNARWAQFQSSSKWTARNVWTGKNTVCIEWEGDVQTRDGRKLRLTEIAVHEIKDGQIQHERFYYNPGALAPAAS
jgi:ketosteroid isomerase-like protein